MRIGLMTLGDWLADPVTGVRPTQGERHRAIVNAAVAADQAGLYSFNVGEHHFTDYILSAPPVMLAAIAERTETIRLSTAVTLMANLDPVRVAEDYATVDLLSGGRVELVAGRGNFFAHTFDAFGQDVEESRERFDEAVALLLNLWTGEEIHWAGTYRPELRGYTSQPRPHQNPHPPVWIGGGSSKESADLAARHGLGLMLPSAFGSPTMFDPIVNFYRERFESYEHTERAPQIGCCWHVNVARYSATARARWEPRYRQYHQWLNELLRRVNPALPDFFKPFDYEWLLTKGPAIAGSPAEVVDRLGRLGEMLGAEHHLLYLDMGGMPAGEFIDMVELIGAEVVPQIA
jgi:alkanesulfonate monooxygenase SsuD/methylene tetrahydromethanopterin reductase-like flavin-dependent oxidoreductase (luciferase family)